MSKPDLEAVIERRAIVARELKALEKMRAEMEAEEQELQVAERVLKRLSGTSTREAREPRETPTPALAFVAQDEEED